MPQTIEKPIENNKKKPKLKEKCSFPQYYGHENFICDLLICVCFLCKIKRENKLSSQVHILLSALNYFSCAGCAGHVPPRLPALHFGQHPSGDWSQKGRLVTYVQGFPTDFILCFWGNFQFGLRHNSECLEQPHPAAALAGLDSHLHHLICGSECGFLLHTRGQSRLRNKYEVLLDTC